MPDLDYNADRFCPVYNEVIDCDLCYDSIMALSRRIKVSSVSELSKITDIPNAQNVCEKCPYSDLS